MTLTKRYHVTISRGPIDVYRSAIAPKKPSPSRAQRDARSAYKIDRDAAGGVVDLVRLSGAKEHRFSRSDRPLCPLSACKLCEAQRAEHRLWL